MTIPKCPHCSIELELDDTYDMEYDNEGMILHQIGHCPKCERDYQWDESAKFKEWSISGLGLV